MSVDARPGRRMRRPVYSLAGTLPYVFPAVDGELVSPLAWRRVVALARRLPTALTDTIYLECRLAEGASQVDVVLRMPREGAEIVLGENPVLEVSASLAASVAWREVRALCADWCTPGTTAHAVLDHLWLEFDLAASAQASASTPAAAPSVFAAFTPQAIAGLGRPALADVVSDVLQPLRRATAPHERRSDQAVLARAIAVLPADACVPYVGAMLGRALAVTRLYAGRMAAPDWAPWIAGAGWRGNADALAATLDAARRAESDGGLPCEIGIGHIDVRGGEVLPRTGFEFTFARAPQLRGALREVAFLDGLVARGLCTAAKRQALARWPGCARATMPDALWPSVVTRRVNCVKLVVEGDRPTEAKGYIVAVHRPLPPASAGGRGHRDALTTSGDVS